MAETNSKSKIRLQKFLAQRGVASRRRSAQLISEGLVTINGETTYEPGFHINPEKDEICINGEKLPVELEKRRTIILYKPRGYICSTSSEHGKTVYELTKGISERIVPVGRLDKESEGLLLMSNDGDLILKLTHPRYGHKKTYEVTVSGKVDEDVLKKLRSAMIIDDYKIWPVDVKLLKKINSDEFLLQFKLKEGRNRQIRKMCEQVNLTVLKLVRTKIGDLTLAGLKPGEWKDYKVTA